MFARLVLVLSLLLSFFNSNAQYKITGHAADSKDTSALIGVTALLTKSIDTTSKTGAVTDATGNFEIDNITSGKYTLRLEYLGYKPVTQTIDVSNKDVNLGTITLKTISNELKGVTVQGHQIRAEQMGDTTQFHADAYKTNPDATAEDLVTKMPGMTSDNSGVKVNGESVQQIYVDGKPFFGTDPTLALKNLPAEVIDKIQVFDKLSDQATFTGFDDGNSQKTMNIITKKNKSEGQFGKIYGGYGTDDKYLAGGSFNSFDGDRRISIIELSNNVNQQNFSSQDLLGVSGGGGGRGGGGGGGAFGGGGGGGNAANNFLTGQQSGITTTHSAGINYSDQWGKKIKVTGSYFFNYTDNVNNTQLTRNYFGDTSLSAYNEHDASQSKNYNNRFNLRLEYTIDSFNSIIFTPNLSYQENYSTTNQVDSSFSPSLLTTSANNRNLANSRGYTSSNNLLLQHKFHKKGRTISLNVSTSLNEKNGDGMILTDNISYDTLGSSTSSILNQNYTLYNNSNTVSSNVTYTEPLGKKSQLMFNYNPSITKSRSDKETDTLNSLGVVSDFDTALSNKYNSTYTTQRGGASYRFNTRQINFMIGANLQYAVLDGSQTFPSDMGIYRTFTDVLPISFFNYKFKDGRNLRVMYRTNISAPSITQLQNVVDVSNPLLITTGNPNLKQDYEQTLIVRYGLTKSKTAHNFFVYAYANYINNYIGTATITTSRPDSAITNNNNTVLLKKGAQLSLPVNLNYYSNNKVFVTYSVPADFVKSNLNFNGGLSYTRTPGQINSVVDYSNNLVPSLGVVLSSNVSENLDFTLSYSGSYNFVQNSIQTQTNNNYYNHTASFKINWIFLKGFVLNTNITHSYYSTLSNSAGNIDYLLWNAYVGYKFFKNHSLEARISAFDLLNQNKSVTRTVTGNYVENDLTNVLKQYFMFQLTYTLRHFKGAAPVEDNNPKNDNNLGMPPGMGPGGWRGGGGGGQNGYGR